ncbi:hypothetical protein [Erwinia amylovora]|uniref:hypothetical protein n=2 Tax=Erwinia amylovora TaxID=552 RepID=UPI000C082A78|nr:hypothetical protein [Erwinia amylovora]
MKMKMKRGQALFAAPHSPDVPVARRTEFFGLDARLARTGITKQRKRTAAASVIDRVTLPATDPYGDLLVFATGFQIFQSRKEGILLSQRALKSYEKSIAELILVGKELGMSSVQLKRMIIDNTRSYTDWDAQPELEQRHSQMVGRSRFQRIG